MSDIFVKTYEAPPVDLREALRYAGVRGEGDEQTRALLMQCVEECRDLVYRACYRVLTREALFSALPAAKVSEGLLAAIDGANELLVFAATVGIAIDRRIARYAELSPARALLFQALGAERIESLCDVVCSTGEAENGLFLGRRFSPGYGDLPLEAQGALFTLLDCPRKIGLTLTSGYIMSPTKSVTAIVGVKNAQTACEKGCEHCEKKDCEIRK